MPRQPRMTPFSPYTGYICTPCAQENGGAWPEGHEATFHTGECTFCHQENMICHVTDWDFPRHGRQRHSNDIEREI